MFYSGKLNLKKNILKKYILLTRTNIIKKARSFQIPET